MLKYIVGKESRGKGREGSNEKDERVEVMGNGT